MIKIFLFACVITMTASCGVMQSLVGIIVDGNNRKPLAGVGIKKPGYGHGDGTDDNGVFHYYNYGSGQPITLQFEKEGYKSTSLRFKGNQFQVIQLDSINAGPAAPIQMPKREIRAWIMFGDPEYKVDSVNLITRSDYRKLMDSCIHILKTKQFYQISTEEHVKIIRCYNRGWGKLIKSDRIVSFVDLIIEKKYLNQLDKFYVPEYDVAGRGTYYAKLRMQIGGGKRKWPYAYYKISKRG